MQTLAMIQLFIGSIIDFFASSSFWVKTLGLLLSLGILVIVHECGHYTFARIFGVKVEKFYLFFNPWFTIFKWKPKQKPDEPGKSHKPTWRDTEYGIGWLPLGGYCKIAGMIDESMDTEQMKKPAQPWEFRSKPAWQRLLIMIGGVLFNFIAAMLIYAGLMNVYGEKFIRFTDATAGMSYCDSAKRIGFVDGDIPLTADGKQLDYLNSNTVQAVATGKQVKVLRNNKDTVTISIPKNFIFEVNKDVENGQDFMAYRLPVVVSQVENHSGAQKAGLEKGDHLVAVNGVATPSYDVLTQQLQQNKSKDIVLSFERKGKLVEAKTSVDGDGKLGFMLTRPEEVYKTITIKYNFFKSIPRGITLGWTQLVNYVSQLKYVFTPQGAKSLGGFGAIGSIFPDQWNWGSFWSITAFLSVILAVMNILPIPALDGGYVLFLLIEIVFKKKFSEEFMEKAVTVGLILLLLLLVFANGNDIYRFLIK